MSSEIADLEADVKNYKIQLETVAGSLQSDPDNAELQGLKTELEDAISTFESTIADLRLALATSKPQSSAQTSSAPEKWSKENHPAFQASYKRSTAQPVQDDPQAPTTFKVNDMVLAKWVTGDKAFYPARITSITGSSASPIYIVTFKGYGNSETLRSHDIKPVSSDSKKRKADGSPAASIAPPPPSAPGVISAAANIDLELASQARKEPSKVSDGPPKPPKMPRKVKANKELEAGKNKWQEFASKGKFTKGAKKDSMFRTGEGVHSRVGFTGSGQTMRKDPTRSRHIYEKTEEEV